MPGVGDGVHHVDTDDHRDVHLEDLGGHVEVAFEVGAVEDVDDDVRFLVQDEVPGDDFLGGIRRKGIDARKVDDFNAVPFLLFIGIIRSASLLDGDARPVADVGRGPGQRVEEGGFATVGVAG